MFSTIPSHTTAKHSGFKVFLNVCKGHMMLAKRKTISFQELWFSTVPSRFSARHTGFTGFLINVCEGHMMLRSVKSICIQELCVQQFQGIAAKHIGFIGFSFFMFGRSRPSPLPEARGAWGAWGACRAWGAWEAWGAWGPWAPWGLGGQRLGLMARAGVGLALCLLSLSRPISIFRMPFFLTK